MPFLLRSCVPARLADSFVGTLVVVTMVTEVGSCALCCGSGVIVSTGSCTLTLICALAGVVIGCGYNGDGVVKETK